MNLLKTTKSYFFSVAVSTVLIFSVLVSLFPAGVQFVFAAPNLNINYQGKLTDSSGVAVTNGDYDIVFKLYTAPTGGSAIWTESRTGGNQVTVTNGLFSVMLGSTSPLTSVNFDQTLYLGVEVESDGEMTPRKVLGTVPSAFEAQKLSGIASSSFLRSDESDTLAATTASTLLTINQSGAGDILNLLDGGTEVFTVLDGGNVGIGTSTPASGLDVWGDFRVGTSGTPALFTDVSSGRVGVGTDSPTYPLHVVGHVYNTGFVYTNGIYTDVYGPQGSGQNLNFRNWGGSDLMTIIDSGNIGIGTTSPASKLDVWGDFRVGTSGTSTLLVDTSANQVLLTDGSNTAPALSFAQDTDTGIYYGGNFMNFVNDGISQFSVSNGYIQGAGVNGAPRLLRSLGTAAAPNYSFKSWNDTGMYAPADDVLAFSTAGTEAARFDAAGNLGIGTTSPFAKLSVAGDVFIGDSLRATGTVQFDALTDGVLLADGSGSLSTISTTTWNTNLSESEVEAFIFDGDNSGTLSSGTLALDSLSYTGTIGATEIDDIFVHNTGDTISGGNLVMGGSTANIALGSNYLSGDGDDEGIFVDGSGNVGIGTTTPDSPLTINVGYWNKGLHLVNSQGWGNTVLDGTALRFNSYNNSGVVRVVDGQYTSEIRPDFTNGGMSFYIGTATTGPAGSFESMTLAVDGNVGIGDTSPSSKLSVAGDVNVSSLNDNLPGYFINDVPAITGSTSIYTYYLVGASSTSFTSEAVHNYAIGALALGNLSTGTDNVAIGTAALWLNTTGSGNNAIGNWALADNTSGLDNSAVGYSALSFNTSGSRNSAFGAASLFSNTSGSDNAAFGLDALNNNIIGSDNVAIGSGALLSNTTGSYNVAVGSVALFDNNGTGTIALGYNAGRNAVSVDRGIFIGYNVGAFSATQDEVLNIGNLIFGTGVDGTDTTYSSGNVGIGTSSPYAKLSVSGDVALTGGLYDNAASLGTNGMVLQTTGSGVQWVATSTLGLGGSGGSVTSVALSAPTGFSVAGSPVTTSGTLALSYAAGYEGLLTASSTAWNTFYQTPSDRITAGTAIDWSGNTLNVDVTGDWTGTLDGIDGANFLRSDTADSASGLITFGAGATVNSANLTLGAGVDLDFADEAGDKALWWGTEYTTGIEAGTLYWESDGVFRWYANNVAADDGTSDHMELSTSGLGVNVSLDANAGLDVTGNITVTGTVDGRDIATDGSKLDGIEALADVTDATNVAAAGAIMDSDFSSNGFMKRTGAGTYTVDTSTYLTSVSPSDLALTNGYVFRGGAGNTAEATSTIFIANNGYVGIGMDGTPVWPLHINAAAPRIRIEDASNDRYSQINADNGNLTFIADAGSGGGSTYMSFEVDSDEKMRVTADGYLGVGTTSPYAKLSVDGDFALTGGLYDNNASLGTNGMVLQTTGSGVQWVATSSLGIGGGDADTLDTLDSLDFLRSNATDSYTSGTLTFDSGTTLDVNSANVSFSDVDIVLDGSNTNFTSTGNFSVNGSSVFILEKATGELGIGGLPNEQLDVMSAGDTYIRVESNDNAGNAGIYFEGSDVRGSVYGTSGYDVVIAPNSQYTDADVLIYPTNGINTQLGLLDLTPDFGVESAASGTLGYFGISSVDSGDGDIFAIDENGNVGIGTNSPVSLLHLNGTPGGIEGGIMFGDGDTGFYESTDDYLKVYVGGAQRASFKSNAFYSVDGGGEVTGAYYLRRDAGSASTPTYAFGGDNNTGMFRAAADEIGFSVGTAEAVRIDSSGNVGIGTTTPSGALSVIGLASFAGTANQYIDLLADADNSTSDNDLFLRFGIDGYDDASATRVGLLGYDGGKDAFMINYGSNSDDHLAIKSDGKIGIGTTTPATMLQIDTSIAGAMPGDINSAYQLFTVSRLNNTAGIAILANDANASRIDFGDNTSSVSGRVYYNHVSDALEFGTNGTANQMVLDSRGLLGIGTADPDAGLHIQDSASSTIHLEGSSLSWDTILDGTGDGVSNTIQSSLGLYYRSDQENLPNGVINFWRGGSAQNGKITIDMNGSQAMEIDNVGDANFANAIDVTDNIIGNAGLDIAGHSAFGTDGSISSLNVLTIDETMTNDANVSGISTALERNFTLSANRVDYANSTRLDLNDVDENGFNYDGWGTYSYAQATAGSSANELGGLYAFGNSNANGAGDIVDFLYGVNALSRNDQPDSTSTTMYGVRGLADNDGWTGTVWGGNFEAQNDSTTDSSMTMYGVGGVIDANTNTSLGRAVYSLVDTDAAATLTEGYGFFGDLSNTGAITTYYGIYLSDVIEGTQTNAYAFWTDEGDMILDGDGDGIAGGTHAGSDLFFGESQDAAIWYDGTNLNIDPDVVGSGRLDIGGTLGVTAGLYDGSSLGTNGQVLQTTGSGVQWVATSSLGISGGGGAFTSSGGYTYMNTLSDNAGIGIAAPASKLHVYENTAAVNNSAGLTIEQDGTGDAVTQYLLTGAARWVAGVDNSDSDKFKIQDSQTLGDTAVLTLTTDEKVGIGTTSPIALLSIDTSSVQATGTKLFSLYNSGDAPLFEIVASGAYATTTLFGGLDVNDGAIHYDYAENLTSIERLALGNMKFGDDAGAVSWIDVPITSSASAGTVMSYAAQIDSAPLLTLWSEADGSGSYQDRRVLIGTSTNAVLTSSNIPDGSLLVANGALCVDDGGALNCDDAARTAGHIYSEGTGVTQIDLAENYPTKDTDLAAGEILMLDADNEVFVSRYEASTSSTLIGVVSTAPGVLLGAFADDPSLAGEVQVPVALSGRVPVRVTNEHGPIAVGDRITVSPTEAGMVRSRHPLV